LIAAGQKPPGINPPNYYFTPPRGAGYWATVANNSIFVVSVDPSGMLTTYFFDDVQQEMVVYVEKDVIHIPMLATSKTPGDTTQP
jgi:hypothetical protein